MRYDDWTIANKHKEIVADLVPDTMRAPHLALSIPGVENNRINDGIRAGVWMAPQSSEVVRQFSSVQDVRRNTLLLLVTGTSTTRAFETPGLMTVSESLRTTFANKRALKIIGELYTGITPTDYQIDDGVRRKYDLLLFTISTTTREDR